MERLVLKQTWQPTSLILFATYSTRLVGHIYATNWRVLLSKASRPLQCGLGCTVK
jgi:hypothetical protein